VCVHFESVRESGNICSWEIMSEINLYALLQMVPSFLSNSFITLEHRKVKTKQNKILTVVEKN
jgi:hypothetical protein